MPEYIDPSVASLGPNVYNAARASNLPPEQAKYFNQLAKQYKKGKDLLAMGDAKARNQFLELDPQVQANIRALFPDRKAFEEEKTYGQEVLSLFKQGMTAPLKLITTPFMWALDALTEYEKTYKTPYPAKRKKTETAIAQQKGLTNFEKKVIGDSTRDGKNLWKWDKVAAYEERYGEALTTLARAIAENRTVEGAIDLYGKADEDMMQAVVYMYDKPKQFNALVDEIAVEAQISPGRDIVDDHMLVGTSKDGTYWQGVMRRLLGTQVTYVLPPGVTAESKRGQKIIKEATIAKKKKVSGNIDAFYTIAADPITWMTGGFWAIGKTAIRGVGGIAVGFREAVAMNAFKTKGQRLAEQFRFVSERKGVEEGYAWLLKEPEVKKLWDEQLGPRLKEYKDADTPAKKASVLESIKFDFPEWYSTKTITTLSDELGKTTGGYNAEGAREFFTYVDDANMMLNGRVDGIRFRRNGIPYARKTRTLTSAMHRVAYSIFNPSSELTNATADIIRKADEDAVTAMTLLSKVADQENKLINPEIDDIFKLQEDVRGAKKLAYKLGTGATRVPGLIRFGEDAIETADNIRNTANLVLPKNIANAVTLMLIDEPLDVQLTVVRNMQYAFMKRLGMKEDDILETLKNTYNGQAGFTSVPDLPIADELVDGMHPLAVNVLNGEGMLAATGGIHPGQLTKAIKQLPFDMIYQMAAKEKFFNLPKLSESKFYIDLFGGFTRNNLTRIWNNNWAAYTLFPRLGIRTNVDEGFFYFLTKPVKDILGVAASKLQKEIKGVQAITGSSAAIGPWKGSIYWLANKWDIKVDGRALDPRQVLTPAQRADIAEQIRAKASLEAGYEVPLSEINSVVIKENILGRIEDILKVEGEEWENWKRVFRNNANFTDGAISSMGARDLAVGKMDKDFFDATFSIDNLTLFLKEMGLDKLSKYSPREIEKLSDREIGITMWDNFLVRFGFNQVKILEGSWLSPVEVFYKNNGLRNSDDFTKARQDLMEQMGATYNKVTGMYDELDSKKLKAALSNYGETVYFRQKGLSDPEIARIYAERMLVDMRFTFHGSTDGFNQGLFDLMVKKNDEVVKAAQRQGKPISYSWSRAATNISWKEFDEATIGMRPTSGYINTRLQSGSKSVDLDGLKQNFNKIENLFEKYPDKALELMDRQVTGFFRLPAMKIAIDKGFRDMKPYEEMLVRRHEKALLDANPSMDPDMARKFAEEAADKTVTNTVVNMATDSVLEFVDNPNIRSNIAMSIRHLSRFTRATEDFHRRVYRLYAQEGPRYLMRMRLLHMGLDNFGSVYEDEKGDEYIIIPTDIVMNTSIDRWTRLLTGNNNFKVGAFNEFAIKFRLINPSFAPDAGVPAFAGPMAGIGIQALKTILREGTGLALPKKWEDNLLTDATTEAADFLDMYALGHIGRNTDWGDAFKSAIPMLGSLAIEGITPAEKSRLKSNYVMQGISYLEAFGNGLPDNPTNAEKNEFLGVAKIAAHNVAVSQMMLGMVSPAFPTLKDSKGLPDFIRNNGVSTWTAAFWDIYQGILKSDEDVADPFGLAVATFIGKNPGKLIYTIPRTEKTNKVFIAKTNELKEWSQENKLFLEKYDESGIGYIFAPSVGEYNPDIYGYLEAAGFIKQPKFKDYLNRALTAKDKERYYAIGDDMNEKLANTTDFTLRSEIIIKGEREQQYLLQSNPELEDALYDGESKGKLNGMLRDLRGIVNDPKSPLNKNTRSAMRIAIDQVNAFVEFSDNVYNKTSYNYSRDRSNLKQETIALLREFEFDPAVKEATRLIFVPLMNRYSKDVVGAAPERG